MTIRPWVAGAVLSGVLVACGGGRRDLPVDAGGADAPSGDGPTSDGPRDAARVDAGCTSDSECTDSVTCTEDTCHLGGCVHTPAPGTCPAGATCDAVRGCVSATTACATSADCADMDPCTTHERCDPATRTCMSQTLDGDLDGDPPVVCGGHDCDDSNPAVSSHGTEICDGADDNCNGTVDEGLEAFCAACVHEESCGGPSAADCYDAELANLGTWGCGNRAAVVAALAACATGSCASLFTCLDSADSLCTCASGTFCGGCVDTTTDRANCGSCGHACGLYERCTASTCVACGAPGEACCNDGTDYCQSGAECTGGTCTACGHAGEPCCGSSCLGALVCGGGTCGCSGGRTACGTVCSDTSRDRANCGSCGHACGTSEACVASACVPCGALGDPCCGASPTCDTATGLVCDATTSTCVRGMCATGRACDPVVGCSGGQICQSSISNTFTVYRTDGSTTSLAWPFFPGGICSNTTLMSGSAVVGSPGACNPALATDDPTMVAHDGCLGCAKCVDEGPNGTGGRVAQCLPRCTPSLARADCRAGYACDYVTNTCQTGCAGDTSCRLRVEDTNGNGVIDGPTVDHRVIDPLDLSTCDATTGYCDNPGTPGAADGIPCTSDSQCEPNGFCVSALAGYPGGYCSKENCFMAGNACASGGTCVSWAGPACLRACTLGAEPVAAQLGVGGHGDTCRAGYECAYDTVSPPGATGGGGCVPGNYNAVTVSNLGAVCTTATACYSPHGIGRCLAPFPGGTGSACTLVDCAGFASSPCGAGNVCADFGANGSFCLRGCTTPADCTAAGGPAGGGCVDAAAVSLTASGRVCLTGCTLDADCIAGRVCTGATASALGVCS